ncbi:MAG: hypothetical protein Q9225_001899 [Loekoesia sp. 1 TL-2023]
MLPQFRVRKVDPSGDVRVVPYLQPGTAIPNALIRVTAAEYDEIIRRCSLAALKYMDDEDGEIVRVGSSLELAQRLEDPIPAMPRIHHRSRRDIWEPQADVLGYKSPPSLQQYHIFDIDDCSDSHVIWFFLEERTRLSLLSLKLPFHRIIGHTDLEAPTKLGTNPFSRNMDPLITKSPDSVAERAPENQQERSKNSISSVATDGKDSFYPRGHCQLQGLGKPSVSDIEDQRSQYFHATNPPRMHSDGEPSPTPSVCPLKNPAKAGSTPCFPSTDLTAEGKRQAQAAGDKLRVRNLAGRVPKSTAGTGSSLYQNRWAFHGTTSQPFTHSTSMLNSCSAGDLQSEPSEKAQVAGVRIRDRVNSTKQIGSCENLLDSNVATNGLPPQNIRCGPTVNQPSTWKTSSAPNGGLRPTLIEVFDDELAKLSVNKVGQEKEPRLGASPRPISEPNSSGLAGKTVANQTEKTFQSVIDRIEALKLRLQLLDETADQRISLLLQTLEQGINTALEGFSTCVESVADYVQETSNILEGASSDKTSTQKTNLDHSNKGTIGSHGSFLLPSRSQPNYPGCPGNLPFKDPNAAAASIPTDKVSVKSSAALAQRDKGICVPYSTSSACFSDFSNSSSRETDNRPQVSLSSHFDGPWYKYQMSTACRPTLDTDKSSFKDLSSVSQSSSGSSTVPEPSQQCNPKRLPETAAGFSDGETSLTAASRFPTLKQFEEESFKRLTTASPTAHRQPLPLKPPFNQSASTTRLEYQAIKSTTNPAHEADHAPFGHLIHASELISSLGPQSSFAWRSEATPSNAVDARRLHSVSEDLTDRMDESRPQQSLTTATPDREFPLNAQPLQNRSLHVTSQSSHHTDIFADVQATNHVDAATVARVQACVDQLQKLGFGSVDEGGSSRLVIYAQAVGGDLGEAIDLMDEEKRAYDEIGQRRLLL